MVERSGYGDGEPCWADTTAPDIESAKRFYTAVLGWDYVESGPEFGNYVQCLKNGKTVAGMSPPMPGGESPPPAWSVYLCARNFDRTAQRIEQSGGKLLVAPMEIPGQGRMLFALDPTGAAFGVWEPGQHTGAQLYGETGAMAWAEVNTRDPAAADNFYQGLFGYEARQIGDGGEFDYVVWMLGGEMVAGRLKMTDQWGDMPPHWMAYFAVDDADAAAERVTANGGQVKVEPFDTGYGRIVVVADPNDAILSLVDPSRRTA